MLQVGGVPAVLKYLLGKGYIDGSCLTVTGEAAQHPPQEGHINPYSDQDLHLLFFFPLHKEKYLRVTIMVQRLNLGTDLQNFLME